MSIIYLKDIEFSYIFLYNRFIIDLKGRFYMMKILVKDLFRNIDKYEGEEVEISGWVKTLRDSKNFGFIEINDGSFFKNVQIVFDTNLSNFEDIRKLSISSSIIVNGKVLKTENAKQPFEIKANNIEKPNNCIVASVSGFIGFLLITSINKINIFPPSNAGIGNKFVIPNEIDITANK